MQADALQVWEPLIANFTKHDVMLSSDELERIQSFFTYKRLRRHQYVQQEGEAARYVNFVIQGLTRTYTVDEAGVEHVLFFGTEGWWVGDLNGFITAQSAKFNIDCLEDTQILQISRARMQEMCRLEPKMNYYFRVLIEKAYVATTNRLYSNLSKTAAARYEEFKENYPHLLQRIPNHQIASFLGITPQSLSRIRSHSMIHRKAVS